MHVFSSIVYCFRFSRMSPERSEHLLSLVGSFITKNHAIQGNIYFLVNA